MALFWLIALLVFGVANFIFSIRILRETGGLTRRIGWFEMRWQVHRQLAPYKARTRARLGRVGGDYYGYWGTLVALGVSLLGLLTALSGGV